MEADCPPKRHCAMHAARRRVGRPSRRDTWRCPLCKSLDRSRLSPRKRGAAGQRRVPSSHGAGDSRGTGARRLDVAPRCVPSPKEALTVPASSEHAAVHMWRRTHGGGVGRERPQRGAASVVALAANVRRRSWAWLSLTIYMWPPALTPLRLSASLSSLTKGRRPLGNSERRRVPATHVWQRGSHTYFARR